MLRKAITAFALVALVACWIYVPWNQVQTNGTGDSTVKYDRLGYGLIWEAPKADKPLISQFSKVSVQPDWFVLAILSAVFGGVAFFTFPQKNVEDKRE